jgi:uncharacterized membrane protein
MSEPRTWTERRLQISGVLVMAGLIIELATLHWAHPVAFLAFLFVGAAVLALGVVIYLYALISSGSREP